jgi:hypothetical protein
MNLIPKDLREIRDKQPKVSEQEAYAQMDRHLAESAAQSDPIMENVEHLMDSPACGDDYLMLAGHNNALLGSTLTHDGSSVLIYDKVVVLENLMKDMTYEEAVEFFDFNIIGSYVGPNTPIFLNRFTAEELLESVRE